MGVRVDRSEHTVERLRRREDQRHVDAVQKRPESLVDLPRVLAEALPESTLVPAARRLASDRRLPDGALDVARKIGYGDLGRLQVVHHLDDPHGALGEREDIADLRKRHRAQQRLDVDAVRYLDHVAEVVREPKGRQRRRRHEDREAPRLVAPELAVVVELRDSLVDRRDVSLRGTDGLELAPGLAREVLELDALRLAARGRVGREVERDGCRMSALEQPVDLGSGWQISVQVHADVLTGSWSLDPMRQARRVARRRRGRARAGARDRGLRADP